MNGDRTMRKWVNEWRSWAAVASCVGLVWPVWAQSADALPDTPPEARQALSVLLGAMVDAGAALPPRAGVTADSGAPARQRVMPRPGETLDRILRRTLSHLPIKDSVLRAAFVEINPDAFVNGSPHRLRAGVELLVPSPEDVRRIMLKDSGNAAAAPKPTPAPAPATTAAAPPSPMPLTSESDMRDWVRYP